MQWVNLFIWFWNNRKDVILKKKKFKKIATDIEGNVVLFTKYLSGSAKENKKENTLINWDKNLS